MLKQVLTGVVCLSILTGMNQVGFAAETKPAAAAETAAAEPANGTMISAKDAEAAAAAGEKAAAAAPAAVKKAADEYKILINLAARSLALYKNGTKVRLYPIGPGKANTPTPVGYYSVLEKDENPSWTDPGDTSVSIPGGAGNPLGQRWMQFYGNYGIHGTNHPESIGNYVSNGCVRMKEADVEELYGLVSVGTPVEVMYNRIVVEKIADNTIVYYIYPDGYDRQSIDVAAVTKWLAGYGVDKFESDEAIAAKISASDGQPTFVAKAYALKVNGQKLAGKAVIKNDITYLPAVAVAENLKLSLNWQPEGKVLVSPYGKAAGYMEKDTLYFNADDAGMLFHLEGGLNTKDVYELNTVEQTAEAVKNGTAVSNTDTKTTTPAAEAKSGDKKTTAGTDKTAASEKVKTPAKK